MTKKSKAYAGTPQDIGCEVFIGHVMPFIRLASKQMSQKQLAELYAGFLSGFMGSLSADFGKDIALRLMTSFTNQMDDVVQELDQGMMQ